MKLAEWSVKNSLFVNLITAFIVVAGIISIFSLNREAFPNIVFDIVQVTTRYPGATPEQMEKLITIPIEKEIKEVEDLKEIFSVSAEGISVIFITIEPDAKNKPKIVNDIQRAVDRAEDLPADLEDLPVVRELTTKNTPILEVSLFGDLDPEQLRLQARRLESVLLENPGVASVIRRGYREPEFSVEVDPFKMSGLHVSLLDVMNALKKTNVNIPGGKLGMGQNDEVILRVSGEFYQPERIKDVIIRGNDRGYFVKIKDVAQVIPTLEELTITNRTDGSESINLMVTKKQSGDIIDLVDEVQGAIDGFLKSAPPGLKITVVNDISYYVKRRLKVLINNGIFGLLFIIVPLFLFLSFRTALSAFLGIITAVLGAFALMDALGISINLMSLFGMIMVLGMLVDEDIVIAENVHRLIEAGKPSREAAILGANQVAKSVIATVLTTITAFLPLLVMKGIIGKFVNQIPLVVIITLAASLFQALFILPSHIADLNKMSEAEAAKYYQRRGGSKRLINIMDRYERVLRFLLRHRAYVLGLFVVMMTSVMILGYFKVPFILFPRRGIEQFFVRVETPIGTPVEVTTERMKQIEKIISEKIPPNELDHYVTQGGITQNDPNDPFTQRASHVGQLWVFLTPEQKRDRNAEKIIQSIRPEVDKIQGFNKVYFDQVRPGPPVGRPVAVRVKGDNFEQINALAGEYMEALKKIPGVKDVKNDFEMGKDELRVNLDEVLMGQAGLTYEEIATAVRIAFDGGVATTIKEGDEEIDVVVRFPPDIHKRKDFLDRLLISNSRGDLIPIKAIAKFDRQPSIAAIKHDDRKRMVTVSADVDESVTTSREVNAKIEKEFKDRLRNFPGIIVKYGGEEEDTQESLESLKKAFVLAVFLTFIIIAVTFKNLWEPFVILTTIPMGIVGVILPFYFTHEPLTFLAMLGVVGFAGVVVDSAILIVDFINREHRERGLSITESIISGSRLRLRAVFLTTVTTILGIIPAALGIGGADPFIQPMAKALNWGIGVGSFLALFMIPVILSIVGDFIVKMGRGRKIA